MSRADLLPGGCEVSYNLHRSSSKLQPGLALGGSQGHLMTGDILACAFQRPVCCDNSEQECAVALRTPEVATVYHKDTQREALRDEVPRL